MKPPTQGDGTDRTTLKPALHTTIKVSWANASARGGGHFRSQGQWFSECPLKVENAHNFK